jgi:hypothetical protein
VSRSRSTTLLALVAALVVLCASAGSAVAAPKPKSSACPTATELSQVFLRYADPAMYYLAPQGDFERSAWSGGSRASGNEPDQVGGVTDSRSMRLGPRDVAVSPNTCIGLDHPTTRFYVQRVSGVLPLSLSVRYTGIDRRTHEIPVGAITPPTTGAWAVTLPMPLLANFVVPVQALGTAPTDPTLATGAVRFVLTAPAGTSWLVDDIYVDPYSRG